MYVSSSVVYIMIKVHNHLAYSYGTDNKHDIYIHTAACTGRNCMRMKTYSVCDSPQDICVAPERLNTSSNTSCIYSQVKMISIMPSATYTAYTPSECIPVTTTAYKTFGQPSKCTITITTTELNTESSPSPKCKQQ